MKGRTSEEIRQEMEAKSTWELRRIWETEYRDEWTDTEFKVVEEILKKRQENVPTQSPDKAMSPIGTDHSRSNISRAEEDSQSQINPDNREEQERAPLSSAIFSNKEEQSTIISSADSVNKREPSHTSPSPSHIRLGIEDFCALGLIIFFFLPWFQNPTEELRFLSLNYSAYGFSAAVGGYSLLLWAIPLGGVLVIILAGIGERVLNLHRIATSVVGIMALLPFFYVLIRLRAEIGTVFKILLIGTYLTFFTGILMILSATKIINISTSIRKRSDFSPNQAFQSVNHTIHTSSQLQQDEFFIFLKSHEAVLREIILQYKQAQQSIITSLIPPQTQSYVVTPPQSISPVIQQDQPTFTQTEIQKQPQDLKTMSDIPSRSQISSDSSEQGQNSVINEESPAQNQVIPAQYQKEIQEQHEEREVSSPVTPSPQNKITIFCSHCQQRYSDVSSQFIGRTVTCKRCRKKFVITSLKKA